MLIWLHGEEADVSLHMSDSQLCDFYPRTFIFKT